MRGLGFWLHLGVFMVSIQMPCGKVRMWLYVPYSFFKLMRTNSTRQDVSVRPSWREAEMGMQDCKYYSRYCWQHHRMGSM